MGRTNRRQVGARRASICDGPRMGREPSMYENPKKGQCAQEAEVEKASVP